MKWTPNKGQKPDGTIIDTLVALDRFYLYPSIPDLINNLFDSKTNITWFISVGKEDQKVKEILDEESLL